jgi:hypothetical protein
MEVRDQLHASAALLPRPPPPYLLNMRWGSPAAGLDVVVEEKVSVPVANQTLAFQVVATHFTD